MSDTLQHQPIGAVVQEYVRACNALWNGETGAHDEFATASDNLIQRTDDPLNESERDQVQRVLQRLSVYLLLNRHDFPADSMNGQVKA